MLTRRRCDDCGRQVRLSSDIHPPRCPACRLSGFTPIIETRPCLRCRVPIPSSGTNPNCAKCQNAEATIPQYVVPCLECTNNFLAYPGVTRCFACTSRGSRVVLPPMNFGPIYSSAFNPSANSFGPLGNSHGKRRRPTSPLLQTTSAYSERSHDYSTVIKQTLGILSQEYETRAQASQNFPSRVTDSQVRQSITRFEDNMEIAARDRVCSSCGRIVDSIDIRRLLANDPLLQPLEGGLDICGWCDGYWNLCSICHAALLRESVPKFSTRNKINVTLCQHYPELLKDLTLTEEYLIAKSHPVGVVVKLRPGGRSSVANYHALRGHFIVIPQDPKPLLRILPSPDLKLTEIIKVFWIGRSSPTVAELRPFLIVRKTKVLAALQYLTQHNTLYQDVTIARSTIENWPDEFVPSSIQQDIICLDESDLEERVGYSVNLEDRNCENDWQAADGDPDHSAEDSIPITASVTVDLNGDRQNPDLRLLSTIQSLKVDLTRGEQPQSASATTESQEISFQNTVPRPPVIQYGVRGQALLLNHWQDPHYFTSAFPTLFPSGVGGHLDERDIPVSLAAFANWALYHHSRRQVRLPYHMSILADVSRFSQHKTFMYLLYDVLLLRNSCLGNSLLIKRSQWNSMTRDLNSLSFDRLREASEELTANHAPTDPLVRRLLKNITAIGAQVPGSFFQKLQRRAELRGLIVREGMPAFWLTINPSDLQNPLVLILAGVQVSTDAFNVDSVIRCATATSDPVAVARFFHHTCRAVLDGLLGSKLVDVGILGDVSNYFGVVESNGRGMLHLHTLVWLRGNLGFSQLRHRILADSVFAARMIGFLESIIVHSLHVPENNTKGTALRTPPSPARSDSDDEFAKKLFLHSNAVARSRQLHSKRHTATCFKYRRRGSSFGSCRFGMPRSLSEVSKIDEYGIVHLARNHAWVNPWNPSIASCIRSNHDISWIPTVSKSLSLLYYITNYATKDDVSPGQMVVKAALLKQSIDRATSTSAPSPAESRLREKGMDKFALRCFNSLSQDREVSGVQVASTILQLPSYYTLNYNFTRLNLWWLRRYVRSVIYPENIQIATSDPIGEEPCNYDQSTAAPATIFDNYKLRGDPLSSLCIFEYCMVVRTKRLQDATTEDILFHETHPRHQTHVQRLARSAPQTATVTLQGELTEFQPSEDAIPGGHPLTTAIQNDLAEILLGLFIPWGKLPPLFDQARSTTPGNPDFHQIWTTVEPTLSPHLRTFAQNIELLRKSKHDCQADSALRDLSYQNASPLDQELTSLPYPVSDSEKETVPLSQHKDDSLNKETLLAAFLAISRAWSRDASDAQQRNPNLCSQAFLSSTLQFDKFASIQASNAVLYESTGLQLLSSLTLQEWKSRMDNLTMPIDPDKHAEDTIAFSTDLDDFNVELTDEVLVPILTHSASFDGLEDRQVDISQSPTGASITSIVCNTVPLNEKQRLVVENVMTDLLVCANNPYDSASRSQTLLYVGGEGGVGKSQIIKAIVAAMDIIHRKDEVILMAPTGAAADVIGGSTYHTSLGISLNRYRRGSVSPRVRRLWSRKTVMVIDEISMVDLAALSIINTHCKLARSLDRSSTDLFGGLPVVILMGDFHQFPPVQGQPLWKLPRNDTEQDGKLIWSQFKRVIILDEQMRQAEDVLYRDLLRRARSGALTPDDLTMLNSKAISSLAEPQLQTSPAIVKLNSLRHIINRLQIERFARARRQKIFVFPALHTRTKSSGPTALRLRADDLLSLPEQGAKIPFPGLILYTLSMPTMVLMNICTPAGLVNGAMGQATGVAVDPEMNQMRPADFIELDNQYIFCTKPPLCLLFTPARTQANDSYFGDRSLPIFPLEMSITVKGYSVRRKQIPICPAFCLTDYKIQGATLDSAILDLKNDRRNRRYDPHRKYCSTYVQLSRLRSLNGLHLLQPICMSDIEQRPDPQLLQEMQRLGSLQEETISAWQTNPCE